MLKQNQKNIEKITKRGFKKKRQTVKKSLGRKKRRKKLIPKRQV